MNFCTALLLVIFLVLPFCIPFAVVLTSSYGRGPVRRHRPDTEKTVIDYRNYYYRRNDQWRYQLEHLLRIENYYKEFDRLGRYFCEIEVVDIGSTALGREIKAVVINNGAYEAILVVGGVYAVDLTSVSSVVNVLSQAMDCAEGKKLDKYNWLFVPLLNPDGYNYTFSKTMPYKSLYGNALDVNINMNFPFHFELSNEMSGLYPFDQLESRALRDFTARKSVRIKLAVIVLNKYIPRHLKKGIHLISYPWWYSKSAPFLNETRVRDACNNMLLTTKNLARKYRCGRASEEGETKGTIMDWLQSTEKVEYVYNIHQQFNELEMVKQTRRIVTELGHDVTEIIIHLLHSIENPTKHRDL